LIEQRPDVRSAEAQLHAASASVGVAVAAMLPQFTLTPNAGLASNQINTLSMTPGTAFWSLVGTVSQTVFDAGTLLHKKRAAEDALDQAAEMYRSTVIAALQNVADTLHALRYDADALKAAYTAERAAFKSLEIARMQLRLGAIGYLGLLTTENTYDTALLALVQAQAARYADTAALFQALGGGWWNRTDVPPTKTGISSSFRNPAPPFTRR
jgi:outer membrane protein TolC